MTEPNSFYLDPNLIEFLMERGERFETIVDGIVKLGSVKTSVKSLQEVVYRYHLLGETARGYDRAKHLRTKIEVLPVTEKDLDTLDGLLTRYPKTSPRELLHVSVMLNNGCRRVIASPDSGYREIDDVELVPALSRIAPNL